MAGAPDLFVVCKNCQSEVSPYITECPYCGQRLRKRAPKIDREGRLSEPVAAPPPPPPPPPPRRKSAPRIRPVERSSAPSGPRRPIATIALVVVSLIVTLGYQAGIWPIDPLIINGPVEGEWWRLLTASFVYNTAGYEAVALSTIGLFGWLLERRHGAWATMTVFLLGTVVGSALVVLVDGAGGLALGGVAPALALLIAWAMRDMLTRRAGGEIEGDMLGVGVWLVVLALMPVATQEAHVLAALGGAGVGVLLGMPLARMAER